MPSYERVVDGKVVERVNTVLNSHEDNRLGVAAVDGKGGWRVAEDEKPAETPAQSESAQPVTPDAGESAAAANSASAEKPAETSTEAAQPKSPRKN